MTDRELARAWERELSRYRCSEHYQFPGRLLSLEAAKDARARLLNLLTRMRQRDLIDDEMAARAEASIPPVATGMDRGHSYAMFGDRPKAAGEGAAG